MALPALYHDAYSFAVREWRALELSSHPSPAQLAQLQALVERYVGAKYPRLQPADRRSAVSYGIAQAQNDLTDNRVGGALGTVADVAGSIRSGAGEALGTAEHAVTSAVSAAERAAGGTLAAILRAVTLPRAALPTRVPTNSAHAFTMLSREAGTTLPTRLAAAGRARAALRNLAR